jgi:hypothetical protein
MSSMYPARQCEILVRYTGVIVEKYETTKQGVSNEHQMEFLIFLFKIIPVG